MSDRPPDRPRENEMIRPHRREGEPPRPATEPHGAEHSTHNDETLTDPATGEPQQPQE
jgi:hypothetical protein